MPPRPSPQAGADGAPADRPAEMTDDDELAGGTAAGSDDESSGSTGSTPPPLEPANTELAAFWVSQAAALNIGAATLNTHQSPSPLNFDQRPFYYRLTREPLVVPNQIQSPREHHRLSFRGNRTGILQPVDTHMHSRLRQDYAVTLARSIAAYTPSSDEDAPSSEADTDAPSSEADTLDDLPCVSATVRHRCLECAFRRWRRACDLGHLAHRSAG